MCNKLIFLTSVVLVLALAGTNVVRGDVVIERSIAAGTDDAEEDLNPSKLGEIDMASSDLELAYEDPGMVDPQLVALRFTDIAIPAGSTITAAWVRFDVDETKEGTLPVNLLIQGELSLNPADWPADTGPGNFGISTRLRTAATVAWSVPNWETTHQHGPDQTTTNIAAVIQEIIDQSGWASGNTLVLIFTDDPANPSTGIRCAESFEGAGANTDQIPLLHIEYAEAPAIEPDTLSGLSDVTVVDGAIVSLRHDGTEYVVADGDLTLGTTTRWYIVDGVETLWVEGDPAPAATVPGSSNPKEGDVGSNADNFLFTLDGGTNISSIDGIDFQETIFASLTDTFFVFERGGNDVGTYQAILADGTLGEPVAFDKASNGGPYADTGVSVNGQNAYGVVFKTGMPVQGVRITAAGHDTLSISAPTPPAPEPILVDPNSDLAAAIAMAQPGGTVEFAAGTYILTSQLEIKEGVTYRGAGPGLTIIDGNGTTRAFVAWGDRFYNEDSDQANDSGPKNWVLEGMTIQHCVADTNNRFSYMSAAFNLKANFAGLDANISGGLDPAEADGQVGGIRLGGEDLTEGTADDDLHRFAHIDTDASGEISEAELDAQILLREDEFGDQDGDGGALVVNNGAVGTIRNCEFLNNHTPIEGDGDDGGAIKMSGLSTLTVEDCLFDGNYACSPNSVIEDANDPTGTVDGDAGHIKLEGSSTSAVTPGTTLIANRCVFLNGNAEDDGGAIQTAAVGSIVRLDSCWFEGNTTWDNGSVISIGNEGAGELTVTNCVFANNITKADNGPDRMCEVRRNSKFINCTFIGNNQNDEDMIYNNADAADTDADGVDDETADTTQVVNCLFLNNVIGNGDHVLGSRNANFSIAATNCLFFGNTRQNGSAAPNCQRDETGSVTADPLLDANLIPGAGSPAIDAGVDPATVGVPLTTDYNGNARPQGAGFDIGAIEVTPAN